MRVPRISVILPTYRQAERTFLVLTSLCRQAIPHGEYEAIVVDDGNTDGTPELFSGFSERVDPGGMQWHYVRQPQNTGLCAARNRGAEQATGEHLLFLDGDCLAAPDLLQTHLAFHEQRPGHIGVGTCNVIPDVQALRDPMAGLPYAAAPAQASDSGAVAAQRTRVTPEMVLESFEQLRRRAVPGHHYPPVEGRANHWQAQTMACLRDPRWQPYQWLALYPNHFSMSREAFERVGGFDVELACQEGMDLGLRCTRRQMPIKLVPGAEHFHLYHPHAFGQRLQQMIRAFRHMHDKHRTPDVVLGALWTFATATDMYVPLGGELEELSYLPSALTPEQAEKHLHVFRALMGMTPRPSGIELNFRKWLMQRRRPPDCGPRYRRLYTDQFALAPEFYRDKRILDVGCGPHGSLEWADQATRRVGVDPLAGVWRTLGDVSHHRAEYVEGTAEQLPFPDGEFDVVGSFFALDYCTDLVRALGEIGRVLTDDGLLLLAAEVEHVPTALQPSPFDRHMIHRLDGFTVRAHALYEHWCQDPHESLAEGEPMDEQNGTMRMAIQCGALAKVAQPQDVSAAEVRTT